MYVNEKEVKKIIKKYLEENLSVKVKYDTGYYDENAEVKIEIFLEDEEIAWDIG